MELKMEGLKKKMAKMREDADEAEFRARELESLVLEAKRRLEMVESEKESVSKRTQALEQQTKKAEQQYQDVLEKLQDLETEMDITESKRKNLESRELDGDFRLNGVERQVREGRELLEEREHRLEEAQRRLASLKLDYEKVCSRRDVAEDKAAYYRGELSEVAVRLRDLEGRETRASDREFQLLDELRYSEDRQKNIDERCDFAYREMTRLTRLVEALQDELEEQKSKTKTLENECEKTLADLQEY